MASIPDILKSTEDAISKVEHRPFDRFILGPFLIWYGLKSKNMPKLARKMIVSGGIYQMVYAWNEYRKLYGAVKSSPTNVLQVVHNKTELEF